MDIRLPEHAAEAVQERRDLALGWDKALAAGRLKSRWATEQYHAGLLVELVHDDTLYSSDTFRAVVPVSGGLDSTAVYHMAKQSGRPVEPIYIDVGQEYIEKELAALSTMGISPKIMTIPASPMDTGNHNNILIGRNARIIFKAIEHVHALGFWGEVWFGNVMGESHVVGNDKSSRFFNTLQAMIYADGYDFRILSPLAGLYKTDVIRWYLGNGLDDLLRKTTSCYDGESHMCGRCGECFKKVCAYEVVGYEWESLIDGDIDVSSFTSHAKKRLASMDAEPSRYAPKEVAEIHEAISMLRSKGLVTI